MLEQCLHVTNTKTTHNDSLPARKADMLFGKCGKQKSWAVYDSILKIRVSHLNKIRIRKFKKM